MLVFVIYCVQWLSKNFVLGTEISTPDTITMGYFGFLLWVVGKIQKQELCLGFSTPDTTSLDYFGFLLWVVGRIRKTHRKLF